MTKTKGLEKLINRLIKSTARKGGLDERAMQEHVRSLKSLPIPQSIFALEIYLKKVRLEMAKTTLTIETAIPLQVSEIKAITNALKADHHITQVEMIVNPFIYGGLKLKVGDMVYDNSVAERILQATQELKG